MKPIAVNKEPAEAVSNVSGKDAGGCPRFCSFNAPEQPALGQLSSRRVVLHMTEVKVLSSNVTRSVTSVENLSRDTSALLTNSSECVCAL